MEWVKCSGKGKIDSFVINHPPILKDDHGILDEQTKSITAVVSLDEGPRILSDLIYDHSDLYKIRVNMVVSIVFEDIDSENTLFKFRPI